jgi:hypothetical protein
MGDLAEIEALFFVLVGGSPGAEVVFLNQDLAVRSATVPQDFHAYFLGTHLHRLLDLIHEPGDRLRPVKFDDYVLGGVGARTDLARGSGAAAFVQHMLDRVSRILRRVSDRRAAGDVDLAGGAGARCRIGFQLSLAKSREAWVARHPVRRHLSRS